MKYLLVLIIGIFTGIKFYDFLNPLTGSSNMAFYVMTICLFGLIAVNIVENMVKHKLVQAETKLVKAETDLIEIKQNIDLAKGIKLS